MTTGKTIALTRWTFVGIVTSLLFNMLPRFIDTFSVLTTNLDSILKSRDITLPTKVSLAKAMVFPVVVYECESWTIKEAESRELML